MSKIIYICGRNHSFGSRDRHRLTTICNALEPDNVSSPVNHRVVIDGNIAFAVMNYQPSIIENSTSVLLGYLYDRCETWDQPLTDFPDGSYALFRSSDTNLEVVVDSVASRTVWYYFDDSWFLASTSQRAIVMFLGTFEFDERVIPWLLSTGSLGPELSWDKRFTRLPVESSLVLDRQTWKVSVKQIPVLFKEQNRTDNEDKLLMFDAVTRTIESLNQIDFADWALPLSGGYDSRAILCWLHRTHGLTEKLRTITWGLERSINESRNDAKIARDLASTLGVQHRYYHTDVSEEAIENVIDRFLHCGEGRVDHLRGYLDGMKIWSDLFDDGVLGIIRGDEGFGWVPVSSEMTVRYYVGCALCSDYSNLDGVIQKFNLPDQEFPTELERKDESLSAWRDRLYHAYRIPTILAALSDIKYTYVEQITPLLSRLILTRVREMPDKLRTDKALFRQMVNEISPKIPYANKAAVASPEDILRTGPVIELFYNYLRGDSAQALFEKEFLTYIVSQISADQRSGGSGAGKSLKQSLKRLVPRRMKNLLRDSGASSPSIDGNRLAFRTYVTMRMHQLLTADCTRTTA